MVDVEDFQIQVLITDLADCPHQPQFVDAPLIFTLVKGGAPEPGTGAAVVIADQTGLTLYDLDGREQQRVNLGSRTGPTARVANLVATGSNLVRLPDGPIVRLPWGTALPGAFGDSVWAVSGASVREFDLDAKPLGPQYELPQGRTLSDVLAGSRSTIDGLVTYRTEGTVTWLEIWDPAASQVVHQIGKVWTVVATYTDVAAATSTVAWIPSGCADQTPPRFCDLSLTELPSGRTRSVASPADTFGFLGGGAFSSDGRTLAAFVHTGDALTLNPRGDLVLIDVTGGALRRVDGSTVNIGEPYGYAAWTPDNTQIVFGGLDDTAKSYRIGNKAAEQTTIPGSYSLTVVPTR